MKVKFILLLLLTVNAYADQKPTPTSEPKIVRPTKYREIKLDQPNVYGRLHQASDSKIEINEFLNLDCFYVFDYFTEKPVTQEELDKANSKNLPWCDDPSGGTFFKPTGKVLTYQIDKTTQFYVWQLGIDGQPLKAISKSEFVKEITKGTLVKLKSHKNKIIETIETVYTD